MYFKCNLVYLFFTGVNTGEMTLRSCDATLCSHALIALLLFGLLKKIS